MSGEIAQRGERCRPRTPHPDDELAILAMRVRGFVLSVAMEQETARGADALS